MKRQINKTHRCNNKCHAICYRNRNKTSFRIRERMEGTILWDHLHTNQSSTRNMHSIGLQKEPPNLVTYLSSKYVKEPLTPRLKVGNKIGSIRKVICHKWLNEATFLWILKIRPNFSYRRAVKLLWIRIWSRFSDW